MESQAILILFNMIGHFSSTGKFINCRLPLHRSICVVFAVFLVHNYRQLLVAGAHRTTARLDFWSHVSRGLYLCGQSFPRGDHYHDAESHAGAPTAALLITKTMTVAKVTENLFLGT